MRTYTARQAFSCWPTAILIDGQLNTSHTSQNPNFTPSSKRKIVECLQAYTAGSLDPVYHAKANILNDAFQEIGMGVHPFNWLDFTNCAFIYTAVTREFDVHEQWMLLAQTAGLVLGAVLWGVGCDVPLTGGAEHGIDSVSKTYRYDLLLRGIIRWTLAILTGHSARSARINLNVISIDHSSHRCLHSVVNNCTYLRSLRI
ncbi:hypothetical protein V8B97DRAFT_2111531 [Scleroderma yunnanense]